MIVDFYKNNFKEDNSDSGSVDFLDEGKGNPNIFYTCICPKCNHMTKSHVFHMRPLSCSKCGNEMKHAETERGVRYLYNSQEWFNIESELIYDYPFYFDLPMYQKSYNDEDIFSLIYCTVDGRRGIRIFMYDINGTPLFMRFYYDNRKMLQDLLNH